MTNLKYVKFREKNMPKILLTISFKLLMQLALELVVDFVIIIKVIAWLFHFSGKY